MYARNLDERTITLGVSGLLWNRSLVMYDPETRSLWSHILGQAKAGPLRGTQLEVIPSAMTDWNAWKSSQPDSTVAMLSRTSDDYRREFYREPEHFVVGIVQGRQAKAWSFDQLQETPVRHAVWEDRPVVVVFDRPSVTAQIFGRELDGQTLTFRLENDELKDEETGTTWDPISGRALSGPLADKALDALPSVVSYRQTWLQFHPDTELNGD